MTDHTPKAFTFEDEEAPPVPGPAAREPAGPKAFDLGDEPAAPVPASTTPPRALAFDDLPDSVPPSPALAKAAPRALFDSEDHAAVRDAMAATRSGYPALFAQSEQRLVALFRRILPVKLSLVTDWAEAPLMEQAALLQPITELVRAFAQLEVPALIEAVLASSRAPAGMLGKLFGRTTSPARHKADLVAARGALQQLMQDSEAASAKLETSARELTLHWVALAVVADLAGRAQDATLLDVLQQRRTLIQQAVRQAELSVMQMGQVRQQAAELIGQVSSILSVTLPAMEMAQSQKG